MIKIIKICAATFLGLIVTVDNASAQAIKFDISRSVNEVLDTVSHYMKIAQEKMDEVTAIANKNLLGDAKEALSSVTNIRDEVKKATADVQKIKDQAAGIKSKVTEQVDSAKDTVDGVKDKVSKSKEYADAVYKVMDLQNEAKSLKADLTQQVKAQEIRLSGELSKQDNNIKVFQEQLSSATSEEDKKLLQEKISFAEKQKGMLKESFTKNSGKLEAELNTKLAGVNSKINELNDFVNKLKASASGKASSITPSIFDEEVDTSKLLTSAENSVFIPKGAPEDSAAVRKVRSFRDKEALNANKQVFARALQIKMSIDENNDLVEKISEGSSMQDGSNAAVSVDMELKAENMKAILNYAELIILDLKATTAMDLSESATYKPNEVTNNDISQLNLCAYKYTNPPAKPKSAGGQKNDLEDLKGILGVK